MSPLELCDKWEAEADRLLQTAQSYRSTCNASLKSSYIGRAKTLKACAVALREVLAQEQI